MKRLLLLAVVVAAFVAFAVMPSSAAAVHCEIGIGNGTNTQGHVCAGNFGDTAGSSILFFTPASGMCDTQGHDFVTGESGRHFGC